MMSDQPQDPSDDPGVTHANCAPSPDVPCNRKPHRRFSIRHLGRLPSAGIVTFSVSDFLLGDGNIQVQRVLWGRY
jgi:hypothetical protein